MRVVTLATRFSTGGAQLNSLLIAEQLAKRGHDTESWFLMRAGEMTVPEGLPTTVMTDSVSHGPANVVRCLRRLLREANRFQPQVIIGFHPLANIMGALAAGATGGRIRFIGTQRNPSSSQGRFTGRIESVLGASPLYDANIAVTGAVAQSYGQHPLAYRKKLSVVHNGSPELVKTRDTAATCRARFGLPTEPPILGSLGRLAEQKNPAFLTEVLARLPDHAHLAFAGDGPLRQSLEEAANRLGLAGRVHFVGEIHGEDVARFYRAIDVFALSSHYEGFGRTLVEAMASRVPVVAHLMPVTEEVVADAGLLLPLDPDAWAIEVQRLFESADARGVMAEKGEIRASAFTVSAMVDGYEALALRSTLAQRQAPQA